MNADHENATCAGEGLHGHGIQGDKPLSAAGIQADKPLPPWESLGGFRLDCKPHRAGLLEWSAIVIVILILLAPITYCLPLFVVFPLSLATWLSARRDLALMEKGLMDPAGEARTRQARTAAFVVFCMAVTCCWGVCALLLWVLYGGP